MLLTGAQRVWLTGTEYSVSGPKVMVELMVEVIVEVMLN